MENKTETPEEKVTISKKEYDSLIKSQHILNALEQGGVDNWEWYGDSIRDYFKEHKLDLDD